MEDDDPSTHAEDSEHPPARINLVVPPPAQASQFEEALRESVERYGRLFENHHASMLVYDPETFSIIDANPAACRYYGYTRTQLVALKITDLNGRSLDQAACEYQQVSQTDEHLFC